MRGSVKSSAVILADFDGTQVLPDQHSVHDGGFPYPGGPEQSHSPSGTQKCLESLERCLFARAAGNNRDAPGDRGGFRYATLQIIAKIGFIEDDDRRGAALRGERQIAFQAANVEIAIEAADEKYGVDIGRNWLLVFAFSGGTTRKQGPARQHGFDNRLASAGIPGGDPIADHGHSGATGGAVPESAGGFGLEVTGCRDEPVLVAL